MKTKLFYKQMTRSVKTVAVNVVILAVVTAFFCMSLNLYSSSMHNLQMADDTYRTVAIMELYGDVDQWGDLTTPESEGYQGYRAVGVTGYDLEDIVNAAGVLDYDLRQRYAAYIVGQPAMLGGEKHRAVAAVLVCALAVALLGAAPGAALGHSLSERVGETLLAGDLEESHRSAALRANVLANEDGEGMELSVQAQAGQSLLAACGALLFPLLTLLFVVGYIGKEPRALLPQNRD